MPMPVELCPANGASVLAQKPGCVSASVRTLLVHMPITFAVKDRQSPG